MCCDALGDAVGRLPIIPPADPSGHSASPLFFSGGMERSAWPIGRVVASLGSRAPPPAAGLGGAREAVRHQPGVAISGDHNGLVTATRALRPARRHTTTGTTPTLRTTIP